MAKTREDAEAAELQDRGDRDSVRVYTDGSGLGGEIGAAAVLYRGETEKGQKRYHLGTIEEHTVYEGECVGVLLGLELMKQQRNIRNVTMYIDSQAVIQAATSNKPAPGHYLLDEAHKQYRIVRKMRGNMDMIVRWSPGHSGIPGNEAADKAAREAAEGNTTTMRHLPRLLKDGLPHSRSAARQTDRQSSKEMAAALWKRSTRYERINYLVPDLPRQSYFTAIAKLSRKHTSIITQIITGHIPLARHLHRINKADSPICPCCHEHEETVAHFVLHCPTHRTARTTLFEGMPRSDRNLPHLLSTKEARAHLLNFIARTTRLRSVFGDIPLVNDM
jgi:ribonuclease HI